MEEGKLYVAYGSNLSLTQMRRRCPTARVVGLAELMDYELLFRGRRENAFATIEPKQGSCVPVMIWKIQGMTSWHWTDMRAIPTYMRRNRWRYLWEESRWRPWYMS